MKRTPITRRTRLAAGQKARLSAKARLARRTRLRERAPTPKRWTTTRTDRAYRAWIRALPCLLAHTGACWGPVDPCHVTSRGAGGFDEANLYPGCRGHHSEQHAIGIHSFQAKYGLDLHAEAVALDTLYRNGDFA